MRHGVFMFPTHDAIDPWALARLAEDYGFESLFFPEHSHIPASRLTPFPLGGELPRRYSHTLDLFVALTASAMATSRLLIGSGACLVAQRDPIYCAKEVASVDRLSGGRFLFGVAAGWNEEEAANHGTDPHRRFAVMREKIEAMRAIWTEDEASYHGRFVTFDRIWSWPKPLQQPHPPLLLGGNGPRVLDRVLAYDAEWCPNPAPGLSARIAELRSRALELGRDIPVSVYGAPSTAREMAEHADAGATRYVHALPSASRGEVERTMNAILAQVDELDR
jgi:probable F420-dependent oxidoreductase